MKTGVNVEFTTLEGRVVWNALKTELERAKKGQKVLQHTPAHKHLNSYIRLVESAKKKMEMEGNYKPVEAPNK